MSKPICVIYLPDNMDFGGKRPLVSDFMAALNNDYGWVRERKMMMNDYWKDYYWFCFFKAGITEPEFKVFHEKDFTETDYEELRKLIKDAIEEMKENKIT